MSSMVPLLLATLVQGAVFVWLAPSISAAEGLALTVAGGAALGLGGWQLRMRRKPMGGLLGRLETMASSSAVPADDTDGDGELEAETSEEAELSRAVLSVQKQAKERLSETRKLRAQAEDAGVYRTAFLQAVAHELRTPLNAILGFADVLLAGIEGPLSDDRRENVEVLRGSAKKLLSLFNDAIELSTMASGQLSLRRERVDLRELLEEAVSVLHGQLARTSPPKPVHLAAEVDDAVPMIRVQRDRLLRVLEILGSCALARTAAGALRFVAYMSDDAVSIEIYDDGATFTKAEVLALFTPERATDSEMRRDALRLAIARQLATLHGGMLVAMAEPGGPRLVLTLPNATSEPPDA